MSAGIYAVGRDGITFQPVADRGKTIIAGDNQFLYPFSFFVIAVWIVSTAFWIIRMNKALALFNGLFIIPTLQVIYDRI